MHRNRLNLNRQITPLPARSDSVTPNSDARSIVSKAQEPRRVQYEQRRVKVTETKGTEIAPHRHESARNHGPVQLATNRGTGAGGMQMRVADSSSRSYGPVHLPPSQHGQGSTNRGIGTGGASIAAPEQHHASLQETKSGIEAVPPPHESFRDGAFIPSSSTRPAELTTNRGTGTGGVPKRVPESVQAAYSQRREQLHPSRPQSPIIVQQPQLATHSNANPIIREYSATRQPSLPRARIIRPPQQEGHYFDLGIPTGQVRVPLPSRQHYIEQQPQQHQSSHVHVQPPSDPSHIITHAPNRPLKQEHVFNGNPYPHQSPVVPQPPQNHLNQSPVREYSATGVPSSPRLQLQMNSNYNPSPTYERTASGSPYPPQSPITTPPQIQTGQQQRSPHMQRAHPMQQSHLPSEPQSHGQVLQTDMFHALITRMDRVESTLATLKDISVSSEQARQHALKVAMEQADQKQRQQRESGEKEREMEKEKVEQADGQQKILRYLALLSQHIGEIGRNTAETRELLGVDGSASAPMNREDAGFDAQVLADSSLTEAGMDIDTHKEAQASASNSSRPGLRGWQPQNGGQSYEYVKGPDLEGKSKGRSVIERLQSMEKTQTAIVEWWEEMKNSSVTPRMGIQKVDGQVQCEIGADTGMPQAGGQPLIRAAMSSRASSESQLDEQETQLVPPQLHNLSTSSSIDTVPTRDSIDIDIADAPPASSSSTSTLVDVISSSKLTLAAAGNPVRHANIILNENSATGPVVSIYATGNAGLRLLELARRVAGEENAGQEAAAAQGHEGTGVVKGGGSGQEAMEIDVFESRPNLQVDVRKESAKRLRSQKSSVAGTPPTVVGKDNEIPNSQPRATPSLDLLSGSIKSTKDAATSLQNWMNSASGPAPPNEEPPASLKIKIRPLNHRVYGTPTRPGCPTASEHSCSGSPDIPATSTSNVIPKSNSPFGFSPVKDWSNNSFNSKSFSFDLNHAPTSTPTRSVRVLRSSSHPEASPSAHMDGRKSVVLISPTKTAKTRSSLRTESRQVKMEAIAQTQEMGSNPMIEAADGVVQSFANSRVSSPQKSPSPEQLDNVPSTTPESSALFIRIPSSSSRKDSTSQAIAGPCAASEAEELDSPTKQVAERALKGLLDAQAMSPHKSYSVALDVTSPKKSTIALMDPPISPPTRRAGTPTSVSPFLSKSYTLPTPPEGTVAALRQQTLGHPFVYAGAGLEPSRKESREAKKEELENIGISAHNEVQAETQVQVGGTDDLSSRIGEKTVSVEDAAIQADNYMEPSAIHPSEPANDVHEDHDDPMEDAPLEQVEVRTEIQIPSPRRLIMPIFHSASPMLEVTVDEPAEPLPDFSLALSGQQPALSVADSMEIQIPSPRRLIMPIFRAASPMLEVTVDEPAEPLPDSSLALSGQQPALAVADSMFLLHPLSPTSSTSQPQLSLQDKAQSSLHTHIATCPISPPPATSVIEQLAPSTSISDPETVTPTIPQDTICPPLVSALPIENAVSLPASQSSTSTVDEQQVDSLLMDDIASSSPVKVSVPALEWEPLNDVEQDTTVVQEPTQRYSPEIPSSCSPPGMQADDHNPNDILNVLHPVTNYVGPSQSVADCPSTPSAFNLPPPPNVHQDLNRHGTRSPSVHVPSPPADEESLQHEAILQIKAELDISSGELLLEQEPATPAAKAKGGTTKKATPVREYLYISDSSPEKRPVKRPSAAIRRVEKGLKRSPSIISISSDDDDADHAKINLSRSSLVGDANKASETLTLKLERVEKRVDISAPPPTLAAVEVNNEEPEQAHVTVSTAAGEVSYEEALSATSLFTKELSPMSDMSEPTPPPLENRDSGPGEKRKGEALPVVEERGATKARKSSFDFKKYSAKLDADDDVPVIPLKKKRTVSGMSEAPTEAGSVAGSEKSAAPAKRSRLIIPKRGPSAAVTRVKKRKNIIQDSDDEEQPPLKKANLRKDLKTRDSTEPRQEPRPNPKEKLKTREQPVRSPAKKAKVEAPKTPTRRPRGQQKPRPVVWPTIQKPNFEQFIKCDLCECWYHLGCVGVGPDDPCMDDAELYTCPPCVAGVSANDSESPLKVRQSFNDPQANTCSRPKCQCPKKSKKKKLQPEEEKYVVESFIGRHRRVVGGKGTILFYLVKWHGYPCAECTWEPLDEMGLSNASILIQTFEAAAMKEEVDLDDSTVEYVLLQEALDAGWQKSNGLIGKPE